ncbi:MAG: ATP-dependent DNA helicase [Euryarchaeota archaeon]
MVGDGATPWMEHFAHSFARDQQGQFMADAFFALENRKTMIAEAPTGLGKTAASLASALAAAKKIDGVEKILFLTGRQSQHKIVVETLRQLNGIETNAQGGVSIVDLIGRESMCGKLSVDRQCFCEEGVSEKAKGGRRSQLKQWILREPRHVEEVIRYANAEGTCPYMCSIEAAREADVIVLDYNHVFVESVSQSSLPSMSIEIGSTLIIIDEAHNLPDRIKMGLEMRLTEKGMRAARFELEEYLESRIEDSAPEESLDQISNLIGWLRRAESRVANWMNSKKGLVGEGPNSDALVEVGDLLQVLKSAWESSLKEATTWESGYASMRKILNEVQVEVDEEEEGNGTFCYRLLSFLEALVRFEKSDAMALVFDVLGEEGRVTSCLLDPSVVSSEVISGSAGSIFMSGTLHPTSMYADLLGAIPNSSIQRSYSSPFPTDQRPILICSDVTTKYTSRSESNLYRIREHISEVLTECPGNVAIFAPSYNMLGELVDNVNWVPASFRIKMESADMSKQDVTNILSGLGDPGKKTALIAVMGGRFSEGVDYSGGVLSAAITLGLPLPPPSSRQTATVDYLSSRFGRERGWRYSSSQPAVNSVLQALGRPIRKEEDRAILVVLENRLLNRSYSKLMPNDLITIPSTDPDMTGRLTRRFFMRYP